MRILTVHNRYLSPGGEDESCRSENQILAAHGHEIFEFLEDNRRIEQIGAVRTGFLAIWNADSYRRIRQAIADLRPDLLDVHNFFPLISPAVYYAARDQRIPVVQTLHNFRLLCPGAFLFRSGHVCQDCLTRWLPWPGILRGCYHGSRLASAAVAAMSTLHRWAGTWSNLVHRYVALSQFSRRTFIAGGLPADKIAVKPNFVYPAPRPGEGSGHYAVFAGRLSSEKGLATILKAWEKLADHIPLKIIGDGPLAGLAAGAARAHPQIQWLGHRPVGEVYDIIGEARFLVFGSEWYETFGRVLIEALAKATPVIAANLGGVCEIVDPGRTGLLFEPGNPADLIRAVHQMLALSPQQLQHMRRQARSVFESRYTAQRNYQLMMAIYHRVLGRPVRALAPAA